MRILLATDGSDDARAATEWITRAPLPRDSEVLVVTVVTFPPSPLDIAPVREFNEALLTAARRIGDDARTILAGRWPDVVTRAIEGDPRERIVETAADWRADLIVVGARGLGTFKGLLLGSVSTAVVRDARCPVLVVKNPRGAVSQIVVAVDGSADSMAAVRFLGALPLDSAATVRLLGVVEPKRYPVGPSEALMAPLVAELEEMTRHRTAELRSILARAEEPLRGKVAAVRRTVTFGAASDEIVAAANEPGVDLVVVGARGLGALKRLILGSVSERVLHHAECPVLVVKHARG